MLDGLVNANITCTTCMWHHETNPCNYLEQLHLTGTVLEVFNHVQNYGDTILKQCNAVNSTHKWYELLHVTVATLTACKEQQHILTVSWCFNTYLQLVQYMCNILHNIDRQQFLQQKKKLLQKIFEVPKWMQCQFFVNLS